MIRLAAAAMFLVAIGSGPALAVRRRDAAEGLPVVWIVSSCAAYATTLEGVAWQVATSLDRVAATPLPGAVAAALGSLRGPAAGEAGRSAPPAS